MTSDTHDPEGQRASGERGEQASGGTAHSQDGHEGAEGGAERAAADSGEAGEAGPEARIAELEKQADDLRDKWMRAQADLENHRRRARKEVEDAREDGKKRTLAELLPVVDNLERALEHAGTATTDEAKSIVDGVNLVMRQLSQSFDRLSVQPIEAEGKPFDPAVHEAMSQIETAEVAPGAVAQVLQRGYTLGDKLLRPALVVVAKAPEREESAGPNGKSPDDGEER